MHDYDVVDCRTLGCGKNAECIREQAEFVCRCPPGTKGLPNIECQRGESTPVITLIVFLYLLHDVYSTKAYCKTNAFVALDVSLIYTMYKMMHDVL